MANIQPVNVMVEDVTKTAVEFPCTSDNAGGSVQDPLQLFSPDPWRVGEKCMCIAGIYTASHKRMD